jgi:hypothetical protein
VHQVAGIGLAFGQISTESVSDEMRWKFLRFFGWFMIGCTAFCLAIL